MQKYVNDFLKSPNNKEFIYFENIGFDPLPSGFRAEVSRPRSRRFESCSDIPKTDFMNSHKFTCQFSKPTFENTKWVNRHPGNFFSFVLFKYYSYSIYHLPCSLD